MKCEISRAESEPTETRLMMDQSHLCQLRFSRDRTNEIFPKFVQHI
jgi:hypothetical protein